MPVISIDELAAMSLSNHRFIGLDLGTKTIGIAISDIGRQIATARETLKRTKFQADARHILALCEEEPLAALVLGLPINMDGSEGPRAQSARAFARNLLNLKDLPVLFWDERLSTVAAERALLDADTSRAKRADKIDQVAAAFILQGALDRLKVLEKR